MNNKLKHLEMVQEIINRMASNSFMLKGWAVTLIVGAFALIGKDSDKDKSYYFIAYIPIVVFWFLDAYYLLQERLYRSLYEKICKTDERNIDFSLLATSKEFISHRNKFLNCLFSITEFGYYFPLFAICTGIIISYF
jgi:hypothetical protein